MTSGTGFAKTLNRRAGEGSGTRPREAFTLLELTIVLFILGLLAALMAPSFKGFFASTKGKEATSGLRQSIRLTQQRAANQGEVRVLTLDFDTGAYYVAVPARERSTRREEMELRRRLPESYRFGVVYFPETEEVVERDEAELQFFPDGTTRDTEVVLVETDKSGKDRRYYVVTIQGTTGHVTSYPPVRADQNDRPR